MTFPDFANWVPLPAPITSGSGVQSFTDPIGDVWVAANGVNSGAWRRARDVLHCHYYRNAAWTWTTATSLIGHDTVVNDPYGMYTPANATITFPISGVYSIFGGLSGTAGAVGSWIIASLFNSAGVAIAAIGNNAAVASQALIVNYQIARLFTANDTATTRMQAAANLAGTPGINYNRLSVDYLGTG